MQTIAFSSGTREIKDLHLYLPQGKTRAVVQVVHGMAEHAARYTALAQHLAARGYAVALYDLIGHGPKTPKQELGWFGEHNGWQKLIYDIDTVHTTLTQRYPGYKQVLLGHSMGSFLSRDYVLQFSKTKLDGLVLSGTGDQPAALLKLGLNMAKAVCALGGAKKPSRFIQQVSFRGYNKRFAGDGKHGWLTRDAAVREAYDKDPYCGFPLTGSAYRDFFKGLLQLADESRLQRMDRELPVLFLSGDLDPVGDEGRGVKRVEQHMEKAGVRHIQTKLYKDARHEPFNETNRAEVFEDLCYWLDRL